MVEDKLASRNGMEGPDSGLRQWYRGGSDSIPRREAAVPAMRYYVVQ